ncbi:hypothetical protein [Hymenobacter metallilatus]|uniref:Uncharacterized protein n=1 Tax=Hymenobacter metallilatus TaxID=2493666 RepID=A0A428JT25_9BACT|nr:hypothetical protein [Hymenobacter metallilatus]RSK37120.1 hypothetical protein EI290_00180 [Hymenobacter metallilatus]
MVCCSVALWGAPAQVARKPACQTVHTGQFRLSSSKSSTDIRRTDSTQYEVNQQDGIELVFKVRWLDDCTYELYDKQLLKGPEKYRGQPTDVLRVHIMGVTARKYKAVATSNFSDLQLPVEIDIVP